MTEKEKREAFFEDMVASGAKKNEQKPLVYRLLWSLGINIPPPLFITGGQEIIMHMCLGGGFYGVLMWLFIWREAPEYAFAGGFLFGLFFAFLIHFKIEAQRREFGITGSWSDYTPERKFEADPDGAGQRR